MNYEVRKEVVGLNPGAKIIPQDSGSKAVKYLVIVVVFVFVIMISVFIFQYFGIKGRDVSDSVSGVDSGSVSLDKVELVENCLNNDVIDDKCHRYFEMVSKGDICLEIDEGYKDECYYYKAILNAEFVFCDKINDEKLKEECVSEVEAILTNYGI